MLDNRIELYATYVSVFHSFLFLKNNYIFQLFLSQALSEKLFFFFSGRKIE